MRLVITLEMEAVADDGDDPLEVEACNEHLKRCGVADQGGEIVSPDDSLVADLDEVFGTLGEIVRRSRARVAMKDEHRD